MSSPSALTKVNYLAIRHLHFESVLGDLQEGNGCASRCQLPLSLVPIPTFRAQNWGFCALLPVSFSRLCFLWAPLSAASSRWLPATAPRPASSRWLSASAPPVSSPQRPGQQHFPDGALPRLRLSQGAPPRRPGQQQTSSGGEKYSGLASNLAHLGWIC